MLHMDTKQPCRCDAYKFPHRLGGGECQADEYQEPPVITMPGREHFDSDREYWAEALRRE